MASNQYVFITNWQVAATCEEVYRILEDPLALKRWWPSVYLDVKILEKGDTTGVGKIVELYTKGFLPYTLRWKFRVTKTDFPNGFELEAFGDFAGKGIWEFTPDKNNPALTNIKYDWRIIADKPLLKNLSFIMKPIFSANHLWAMKKGLGSLQLEIKRTRAKSGQERSMIPPPPKPVFPHNLTNNQVL